MKTKILLLAIIFAACSRAEVCPTKTVTIEAECTDCRYMINKEIYKENPFFWTGTFDCNEKFEYIMDGFEDDLTPFQYTVVIKVDGEIVHENSQFSYLMMDTWRSSTP